MSNDTDRLLRDAKQELPRGQYDAVDLAAACLDDFNSAMATFDARDVSHRTMARVEDCVRAVELLRGRLDDLIDQLLDEAADEAKRQDRAMGVA